MVPVFADHGLEALGGHCTLAARARMRVRGHGVILQVGSALAYRGIPFQAAYRLRRR
jgi:short-subunit dehydrogenase